MLKIIIAEDDPSMRLVLNKVLQGIPDIDIAGEAENGRQLIQMVEALKPDVIFVDIDMPQMNGIDAAKEIFDLDPEIFIIFATAFANYTHEAFEVYAFDYLVKPFNLERIRQTIKRIRELKRERDKTGLVKRELPKTENVKLFIQSNDKCSFINLQDIILIMRSEHKTTIITTHGPVSTYEALKSLEEKLTGENFFRSHKGYIINANLVTEILPWGIRTYMVKLANASENALMTLEKVREFKAKYCV
ncbi:MAG: LytTR family DNA-binding domain-containing protein [Thermincola sp.]|jgi:two-component system LytT family response regulator|nr:LytTR family DNA-binding domain-containing protein [Thermincola sp.]MDT3702911.1 LytTR family DNA-binding domain-containing protein [Thermincola sp.]